MASALDMELCGFSKRFLDDFTGKSHMFTVYDNGVELRYIATGGGPEGLDVISGECVNIADMESSMEAIYQMSVSSKDSNESVMGKEAVLTIPQIVLQVAMNGGRDTRLTREVTEAYSDGKFFHSPCMLGYSTPILTWDNLVMHDQ